MDSNTAIVIATIVGAVVLITVLNPRLRSIAIRLPGKLKMDVKNNPQAAASDAARVKTGPGVNIEKSRLRKSALRLVPKARVHIGKSKLEDSPITIGKSGELGPEGAEK